MKRELILKASPEFALDTYRKARNLTRKIFFKQINIYHANKYKQLVLDRFVESELINSSGHVLDIGANVGNFSQAMRILGCAVTAVEPHPDAVQYLRKRFFRDSKINILDASVGRHIGEETLYVHKDHAKDRLKTSISASLIQDKFQAPGKEIKVRQVTLGELLKEHAKYSLIKIDIEGFEMYLVDDLISNAHKVERLLVETHHRFMSKSKLHKEYKIELEKLQSFIQETGRDKTWLTDWV